MSEDNYKYTGNWGVLVNEFMGRSSSQLSLERRLNIINLLSGLCESEGINVIELIRNFNVEFVEKHLENPKVKGFFLIAGKTEPQSKLTNSEIETVTWVASELSKYQELLRK